MKITLPPWIKWFFYIYLLEQLHAYMWFIKKKMHAYMCIRCLPCFLLPKCSKWAEQIKAGWLRCVRSNWLLHSHISEFHTVQHSRLRERERRLTLCKLSLLQRHGVGPKLFKESLTAVRAVDLLLRQSTSSCSGEQCFCINVV